MNFVSKFSIAGMMLAAVLVLLAALPVMAHDDATYEDLLATYGNWTREDVEAAGYQIDPFCVDAAAAGAPAQLGAMGFHAVNFEFIGDGEAHTTQPDIILLDGDGKVIGVEYEIDSVVDDPPTVAGQPLVFTPPHPGVEHEHMSLHVYFVGDESERFGTWNTAVTCPAGSTPPPPPAQLPETGATSNAGYLNWLLLGLGIGLLGSGLLVYRIKLNRPA